MIFESTDADMADMADNFERDYKKSTKLKTGSFVDVEENPRIVIIRVECYDKLLDSPFKFPCIPL